MKRQASQAVVKKEYKKRKISGNATYGTVPRTRGVYAVGEHKYFDQNVVINPVPSSISWASTMVDDATALTLFSPAQGAAINERIGREVDIHKIRINGSFWVDKNNAATASVDPEFIRLALVVDTQTNAAQMSGADLFGGSTIGYWNNFQNLNNFGRFRVLKDKLILIEDPNFGSSAVAGTDYINGKAKQFKWTISFKKPLRVRFNGSGSATVASIVDNSLHLVANSSISGIGTVKLLYASRIVYTDA